MILTFVHAQTPADQYRIQLRCRDLADAIGKVRGCQAYLLDIKSFVQKNTRAREICARSDILVIHRYMIGQVLQTAQYWMARDKKVVVDFDNALQMISPGMEGYAFWFDGLIENSHDPIFKIDPGRSVEPVPLEQFKWGLRLASFATVSSDRLADDWSDYGDIRLVRDYPKLDRYLNQGQVEGDEVCLGINLNGYSPNSLTNSGILEALEEVCRQRSQVRVLIAGMPKHHLAVVRIPDNQLIYYEHIPAQQWPVILSGVDVGLIPLNGDYDLRSSWAGMIEYMAMKIPWIASSHLPHRELLRFGWQVTNSASNWQRVILELVDHVRDYQAQAALEPYLFALGQDVNENVEKILTIYGAVN